MQSTYSLAEARQKLTGIVEDLKREDCIQLTQRGKPVAVMLSMEAYQDLTAGKKDFWEAYEAFRASFPFQELDIGPTDFEFRDPTPGREVEL